jgi:replicative DNA helicase
LSQLSREVEKRGTASKRPQLSDLRESGAIEQDADMVMFIYRPEYYGMDVDENGDSTSNTAEIIIAKNRNGSLNNVKLTFIGQFTKFKDLEVKRQEDPSYHYTDESSKVRMPNPNVEAENRYTRGSRMNDMPDEDLV